MINTITGLPPTNDEKRAIIDRASEIARNPYTSPEQAEWAEGVLLDECMDILNIPLEWDKERKRVAV